MSRRRRAKKEPAPPDAPPLSGIALLMSETPVEVLDLHGLSASQAESRILGFLRSRSVTHAGGVVHIVTGRGNRSEVGPVLRPLVASILADEAATFVEEAAGLQGGGGFAVRLR